MNYRLLPDNKLLGPRFGKRFPQVRQALAEVDPAANVGELRTGRPLQLTLDGETVELSSEEVLTSWEMTGLRQIIAINNDRKIDFFISLILV